jgi:hypothetical protein
MVGYSEIELTMDGVDLSKQKAVHLTNSFPTYSFNEKMFSGIILLTIGEICFEPTQCDCIWN